MGWLDWIAQTGLAEIRLPNAVALAAVAAFGYLLGRRRQPPRPDKLTPPIEREKEIARTRQVAHELEGIADKVRRSLARHHASLARFQHRFNQDARRPANESLTALRSEAEEVLGPTLQLTHDIAQAYDHIRRQSRQLESFTDVDGLRPRKSPDIEQESVRGSGGRNPRRARISTSG